jgi:hypothetical protein
LIHAIAEELGFSSPIPDRKGTAEIANREVPTKWRKSVEPENTLQFQHGQKSANLRGILRVLQVRIL